MSFLISDHELCEYLVLNYKAILIKETIKLNKYNQYIHLNRYLQRHPKRIFITLGDRNIHFFQVEIPDHTIPTLIQTQSHILTHDSTLFLDTIDASCLLITDENINFNLIYLIATFKVLKIIDHKIVQLQEPSQDCIDAFYTTFNLKHGNINQTLQSLCCIIQLSLVYLGLLDNKLVDGILCDATTNAFKQFIASQYTENNKELKLWSLTSIKILVMKIAWIKRRLKKAGFKILKDVYAYPEFMFKSLKRFQKSRQLDVTHIADEATLTKLESAKRSIKLTQPVQAVTGISHF